MTSAMTSCADWLNSTPAETKVERFGLSERLIYPKSEMTPMYDATWSFSCHDKQFNLLLSIVQVDGRFCCVWA